MTTEEHIHDIEKEEARLKGRSSEKDVEDNPSASAQQGTVSNELDLCRTSLQDLQEKYLRLSADFENFKRRMLKEQQMWREMAQADLLRSLLTIVDNFDRAMAHKEQQSPQEIKSWVEGVAMIYGLFNDFLTSAGVKEVPCEMFDPALHEALMHVDSDKHESGAVVTVMEKGYMFGDRVLRPAKVSVAK